MSVPLRAQSVEMPNNAEQHRLEQTTNHSVHWRRWGPYLSERQWGTVREDYSPFGTAWEYFPHDHARSRCYRWGEDGIAGFCDNHQRLCFAVTLWNGRDPILKERLFGLTGNEGNHGEDVKELYYYLDSTPTHAYNKALYKYPQAAYPYQQILEETRKRGRSDPEYELVDTGIFAENRYFDVFVEYAKADVDDVLIRITVVNRGPDNAHLHLLPTFWFRNTWSWGYSSDRPVVARRSANELHLQEKTLGNFTAVFETSAPFLFTENETNTELHYGYRSSDGFYKDAFHRRLIQGDQADVNAAGRGTKCAAWYQLDVAPGASQVIRLRLRRESGAPSYFSDFDNIVRERVSEADEFYRGVMSCELSEDGQRVQRQAFSGLLWNKQFYHYIVDEWLDGDPAQPIPPPERRVGRNHDWRQLFSEDVLSMPDNWEYPWFAAWDTAFHMIPFALIDADYAKRHLALFLREWYMHPNGELPAYEWAFEDVNPPVHAWACWRVFKIDEKQNGRPDLDFLEGVFHKLLMNFTWWVNRKDREGNNIFEGGFLGLDNIGVFDRSKPLPTGGHLEQSDGTSWMAMYALNMLRIALELALAYRVYEDIASKFFEHFLRIAGAMNQHGLGGLFDEQDGFYYDRLKVDDALVWLRVRSMVGLIPLFAVDTIDPLVVDRLPGFKKRMEWFVNHRPDLTSSIGSLTEDDKNNRRLLSIVPAGRMRRVLQKMLDETEFLSPYGLRSVSKFHEQHPFSIHVDGTEYGVDYEPSESRTGLFGGNSNWRGPIWFPVNYLMIESLQKFDYYYGESFKVEFPTGSGVEMTLGQVAAELSRRLSRLFLSDERGNRAFNGGVELFQTDANFRDHILFYEYFHGDNGAGLGASHQTGWTGLVAKLLAQSGE